MTKKITGMQCALILCITTIGLNFLVFPALFAKYAFSDVYFSVAIGLAIDFLFCVLVLSIMKHNPNVTLQQLISRVFGSVVAKILIFLLAVHLFCKGILIIKEIHNYFNETLFDDINWFVYVVPLLILIGYMTLKDFRVFGRTIQFFVWLIALALVVSVVIPASQSDFSNLLPFFEKGVTGVFEGLFRCSFTFGDYLILFLLMGKVEFKPNTSKTVLTWLVVTDIFVVGFYVVFSAVFGDTGLNHSLALSELLLYTSINTLNGSINWLNILFWLIILFLQVGIVMLSSAKLIGECFNIKSKIITMFIIVVGVLVSVALLYLNLIRAINIITSLPFIIADLSFQAVLLIVVVVSAIKCNKNKTKLTEVFTHKLIKYELTQINGVVIKHQYKSRKGGDANA